MLNNDYNIPGNIASNTARCECLFPAIFERLAGNLLSLDGSATQLQAIFLGVDAPFICLVVLSEINYGNTHK